MSEIREGLAYSREHEWAEKRGERIVRVGITDYAQSLLGDIVFVELPGPGTVVAAGDSVGSIESVKTVSELYSPVGGTVTAVNESLVDRPELVNGEPYDGGWMIEVELDGDAEEAFEELLTAEGYREHLA